MNLDDYSERIYNFQMLGLSNNFRIATSQEYYKELYKLSKTESLIQKIDELNNGKGNLITKTLSVNSEKSIPIKTVSWQLSNNGSLYNSKLKLSLDEYILQNQQLIISSGTYFGNKNVKDNFADSTIIINDLDNVNIEIFEQILRNKIRYPKLFAYSCSGGGIHSVIKVVDNLNNKCKLTKHRILQKVLTSIQNYSYYIGLTDSKTDLHPLQSFKTVNSLSKDEKTRIVGLLNNRKNSYYNSWLDVILDLPTEFHPKFSNKELSYMSDELNKYEKSDKSWKMNLGTRRITAETLYPEIVNLILSYPNSLEGKRYHTLMLIASIASNTTFSKDSIIQDLKLIHQRLNQNSIDKNNNLTDNELNSVISQINSESFKFKDWYSFLNIFPFINSTIIKSVDRLRRGYSLETVEDKKEFLIIKTLQEIYLENPKEWLYRDILKEFYNRVDWKHLRNTKEFILELLTNRLISNPNAKKETSNLKVPYIYRQPNEKILRYFNLEISIGIYGKFSNNLLIRNIGLTQSTQDELVETYLKILISYVPIKKAMNQETILKFLVSFGINIEELTEMKITELFIDIIPNLFFDGNLTIDQTKTICYELLTYVYNLKDIAKLSFGQIDRSIQKFSLKGFQYVLKHKNYDKSLTLNSLAKIKEKLNLEKVKIKKLLSKKSIKKLSESEKLNLILNKKWNYLTYREIKNIIKKFS